MLTTIIVVIVLVIAAILIYAAMRPNSFAVQRTARINAPAEKVFPLINDLKAFTTWSPFETPDLKRTFTGPEAGPGQIYVFESKKMAGDVSVIEAAPNQNVAMRLRMTRPFGCDNRVQFTFAPDGAATDV